jgi:AAA domain
MKLVRLTAENFLRLVAVEITPDGAVVQISGRNGAGKSAVIRALEAALGGKDAVPQDPVRHGADEASIEVDLGDIIVRRVIRPDRTTSLVVTNKDGFRATSPQKMLEGLFGKLLDPVAFSRMDPKQQRTTLADMVGLSKALATMARDDEEDREARALVNRDLKQAAARLAGTPEVPACEPVDVSATLGEIREVRAQNARIEQEQEHRDQQNQRAGQLWELARDKRRMAQLLLDEANAIAAQGDTIAKALTELPDLPPLADLVPLESRLDEAEERNAQHRAFVERVKMTDDVAALQAESDAYTQAMRAREAERRAVIEDADLPIPGLGFGDDCITYNGVPFDQASTAEQLRVSAAIAMASNPKLRVLVIRDGSLLDEDSLRMLSEMAETHDFVLLVEQVDTSGSVGIYIEEGNVAAVNGVPVGAAA